MAIDYRTTCRVGLARLAGFKYSRVAEGRLRPEMVEDDQVARVTDTPTPPRPDLSASAQFIQKM